MTDPVPAPSVAETLRALAKIQDELITMCIRSAADPATTDADDWRTSAVKHQLDKEALEAGARAVKERDHWHERARLAESARVDLLVECRAAEAREAQARAALLKIVEAAKCVRDTFQRDEDQGYRSRDRQFAIDILSQALATLEAVPPQETKQPTTGQCRTDWECGD